MKVFEFQNNTEEWSCEWITTARQATTNTVAASDNRGQWSIADCSISRVDERPQGN